MSPDDPRPSILLVDDDPSVLETIAAILAQEGYDVVVASTAADALLRARKRTFSLLLTDLRLETATSGLKIMHEVHQSSPDTIVIILTGFASLESAIDALREGAYDYLVKPCHVEELKSTVARGLERRALALSLQQRLKELDAANARLRSFNDELTERVESATATLSQKVTELDMATKKLQGASEQRENFIEMIVHELSQPLTIVNGFARMLARQKQPLESEQEALSAILGASQRLTRLVYDLRDTARLSTGRFQVEVRECDLVEVAREQVKLAQLATDRHKVELELTTPAAGLRAVCDRERVAQVLSNLLSNAVKYSKGGEIRVRLSVEGEQAIFEVIDEGMGIPPERLEEVFEPHVRLAEGSGPARGMGLGLYIARGIVEAHGGRIWAETWPGGTSFVVRMPIAAAKTGATPTSQ